MTSPLLLPLQTDVIPETEVLPAQHRVPLGVRNWENPFRRRENRAQWQVHCRTAVDAGGLLTIEIPLVMLLRVVCVAVWVVWEALAASRQQPMGTRRGPTASNQSPARWTLG